MCILAHWPAASLRSGQVPVPRTPGEWVLYKVGLLATVVVTVDIIRKARAALRQRIRI